MLRTPYEEKEPWMFTVTKYKGTIYIKAEQTEYERIQSDTIDTQKQHIFKWGYKFEDYLTQKSTSNLNDIVNTNQQNHVVYQREIDGYNILYGAEVDAVMHDRATPLRLKDCVEFKVNLEITSNQHYKIFAKRKFLHWWTQSYLVGIPTIICGFRNHNGIVRKIEKFSVQELSEGMEWRQDVCKAFLANLLKSLRNEMIVKSNLVFNISWKPIGAVIQVYETKLPLSHILPSWYTKKIF
uniref:Decapping nuclease n=1 Tax=Lepeophtheirus salmonis TaxID=72036 RepID=A0A0K2T377_LEPSM